MIYNINTRAGPYRSLGYRGEALFHTASAAPVQGGRLWTAALVVVQNSGPGRAVYPLACAR